MHLFIFFFIAHTVDVYIERVIREQHRVFYFVDGWRVNNLIPSVRMSQMNMGVHVILIIKV